MADQLTTEQTNTEYDSDHPEVIRAKGEARARVLEARSKLHPAAQTVYAVSDGLIDFVERIGCLLGILIIIIAFFAPGVFKLIFH